MDGERNVGGIRCSGVLALLAEYVDGSLDPVTVSQVAAHLAGCSVCDRFGGEYTALLRAARQLARPLDAGTEARLVDRALLALDDD
jgi:anti-sigma factor RsiW